MIRTIRKPTNLIISPIKKIALWIVNTVLYFLTKADPDDEDENFNTGGTG
jgi:hypothetical protein